MKKIIIIDGGPRKTFNTASMLSKFAEGATSASAEIEVKTIRLYALDYKGCMSCMACKIKGKASNVCKYKDALTPILDEIANADGLVLGSPNYFGEITGQMRAFLERLAFPWLSYNDYSITAPKRMPVLLVETQNGTKEHNNCNGYGTMEPCIAQALGQPEKRTAYNTYQVKDYAIIGTQAYANSRFLYYINEIRSAVLVMHGAEAHSRYFGEAAYKYMLEGQAEGYNFIGKPNPNPDNKQLHIIPGASHCDLYDGGEGNYIPWDTLAEFFWKNLK